MFKGLKPWKLTFDEKIYLKARYSSKIGIIKGILDFVVFVPSIGLEILVLAALIFGQINPAISSLIGVILVYLIILLISLPFIFIAYESLTGIIENLYLIFWYRKQRKEKLKLVGMVMDNFLKSLKVKEWKTFRYEKSIEFLFNDIIIKKFRFSNRDFLNILNGYKHIIAKELPVVTIFNQTKKLQNAIIRLKRICYLNLSLDRCYKPLTEIHKFYEEFLDQDIIKKEEVGAIRKFFSLFPQIIINMKEFLYFVFILIATIIILLSLHFYGFQGLVNIFHFI